MLQETKGSVCLVDSSSMKRLIRHIGLANVIADLTDCIETDFLRWSEFEKSSRVTRATGGGFIELMPVSDNETYGFKYVNCHPGNTDLGLQTVTGFGALSRTDTGHPLMLSEMTVLTALRTAATSVLAAKYLAPKQVRTMAIIGNGAQCEFQAIGFHQHYGLDAIRLYDVDPAATEKAERNLSAAGIRVVPCGSVEEAIAGAQIITTCTADIRNSTILTDNMVGSGLHINAVGGDCEGKTELHADILRRSDIFVEFEPQTRLEGEVQQLDGDHPVTELWQVVAGLAEGRRSRHQITLFDSVGFAIEDFSALRYIHEKAIETGLCDWLDLLAMPEDPRNLFGALELADPQ